MELSPGGAPALDTIAQHAVTFSWVTIMVLAATFEIGSRDLRGPVQTDWRCKYEGDGWPRVGQEP